MSWYKTPQNLIDDALQDLRKKRNVLLNESDYIMMPDVNVSNKSEWETYRQALRDLPQTAENLTLEEIRNISFPTKPSY